ncbi:MAG: SDR family NAD(P)-dependent oxidoreductase [Acidimicrobiales bacterium]
MDAVRDKVAVVTGAASGIGLAIGQRLVAEGARVVFADLDLDRVAEEVEELRSRGHEAHPARVDVRDPSSVEAVAQQCVDRYGAIHIAVNNAGIVNGGAAWELSLEDWHKVLDVNLWGVIHGVRSFVPRILASGEDGHVVNVASMAAVQAIRGLGPYTVAKHGVLGLSDVLRADLDAAGARVGVSVVLPGRIRTGMNPIGTVEPSTVATNVIDAIKRQRSYVFTDDHSSGEVRARLEGILAARDDVID